MTFVGVNASSKNQSPTFWLGHRSIARTDRFVLHRCKDLVVKSLPIKHAFSGNVLETKGELARGAVRRFEVRSR